MNNFLYEFTLGIVRFKREIIFDVILMIISMVMFIIKCLKPGYPVFLKKNSEWYKFVRRLILIFTLAMIFYYITPLNGRYGPYYRNLRLIFNGSLTLTMNFFFLQLLYLAIKVFHGGRSKHQIINIFMDNLFYAVFSSSILVLIGFWTVVYPYDLFHNKAKFDFSHILKELVLHGLNIVFPLMEFYQQKRTMYFNQGFIYMLLFLFSAYCLYVSTMFNTGVINFWPYCGMPWTFIGKIGSIAICFLLFLITKTLL